MKFAKRTWWFFRFRLTTANLFSSPAVGCLQCQQDLVAGKFPDYKLAVQASESPLVGKGRRWARLRLAQGDFAEGRTSLDEQGDFVGLVEVFKLFVQSGLRSNTNCIDEKYQVVGR